MSCPGRPDYVPLIFGRHPCSRSRTRAKASILASPKRGPMICTPIGSPSASASGRLRAGSPVKLVGAQLLTIPQPLITFSATEMSSTVAPSYRKMPTDSRVALTVSGA